MDIRVRYAPSPTGKTHIGNFRTALYNYLFARKNQGVFYLRIEDTDRVRLVEGGIENIIRTLARMGLDYDEGAFLQDGKITQNGAFGPYIQSERLPLYRQQVNELISNNHAYFCFCTSERLETLRKEQEAAHQPTGYDRHCRNLDQTETSKRIEAGEPHVIRFRMPDEGETAFVDLIRDNVSFKNALLDDYVLLKSDGFPTYHLAVVVDDHAMQTSHVLRGEDWVSSTPKHILLYQAFGWEPPQYAHLPLLLNENRSKLSKRQGDVAVEDFLDQGYLPEALLNFVALLGWNPSDEQEIYTLNELVEKFDLKEVNSAGAVFNREKLDWLNGKYIRAMSLSTLAERVAPFLVQSGLLVEEGEGWKVAATGEELSATELGRRLSLEQERVKTLGEFSEATAFLFADVLEYPAESLLWKGTSKEETMERLSALADFVADLSEAGFDRAKLESQTKALIAERGWGNGDTLWPLRVALSGREKSPGPFEIMEILGKMKTLRRIKAALERLA